MRPLLLLGLALPLACAPGSATDPAVPDGPDGDPARTLLDPVEQAVRISMALRGTRPSADELAAVQADPEALEGLIDAWLDSEGFDETLRHLYAEVFRMRAYDLGFPQLGPMLQVPRSEIAHALAEEPLAMIEAIVEDDRPLSDMVTAEFSVLDAVGAALWQGHDYDPDGPAVQRVSFTDGRPPAGILSTGGLWARHPSNGLNHHRGRAELIADALLCESFMGRDVPISGDLDLSDTEAVAQAVKTDPSCVSCHQGLDPLASALWSFQPVMSQGSVAVGYLSGCTGPLGDLCYPLRAYTPERAPAWLLFGLRAPGFYGRPVEDPGDLGRRIADDPRFAACQTRRFWSYFTQTEPADADPDRIARLQQRFVDGGLRAEALARAIVTHPDFLARHAGDPAVDAQLVGPLLTRPFQQGRLVADLTGFTFTLDPDGLECRLAGLNCYGAVDITRDDVFGVRAMTGGLDGVQITRPTHTPTPTKVLFTEALAEEAAGWVVDRDLSEPDPTGRRLLRDVEADTTDEAVVRAQLAALHARILGTPDAVDSAEVDATWALWSAVASRHDPTRAWKATLSALLQSPDVLFY